MIIEGKFCRIGEMFSLDCEEMMWRKLKTKGNKPVARDSHGLCAVGDVLIMFGGAVSQTEKEKLPLGAMYKHRTPIDYGYVNDCWKFCPNEGINNVFVI
jgi:hypothetical protein